MVSRVKEVSFVSDRPENEDDFEIHGPLAMTILELIKENEGGKTLGIEGDWGSGKSSIIRMLFEQVKQQEDYRMIIFDSWEHQGDPLRYSFLKTVLNFFLNEEEYFKGEKWIKVKDIQNRSEKLETKQTLTQAIEENGTYLYALAIAIILLLISSFNSTVSALSDKSSLLFWIWFFSPFACISFIFILALNCKGALSAILNSKTDKSITTSTGDKTSVEFKQQFCEIISSALQENASRKLIIVIDNLDRVSRDDALGIWSTLRTYLEYSEADQLNNNKWRNQIWTLIPYSFEGIKELWGSDENLKKESKMQTTAYHFLEKSFDIRLYVPPLAFSKWQIYLERQLTTCIPVLKNNAKTLNTVSNVFENFSLKKQTPPTPRDIKLFVNELAIAYKAWNFEEPDIPLQYIAYYVLWKKENSNSQIIEQLRDQKFDLSVIKLLEKDDQGQIFYENISALIYHSTRNIGMDLLIGSQISKLLNPVNSNWDIPEASMELNRLSIMPGFWLVLERTLLPILSKGEDIRWVFRAAECLHKANITRNKLSKRDRVFLHNVLQGMYESFLNSSFKEMDENVSNSIIAMSQLFSNKKRKHLVEQIISKISSMPIPQD